MDPFSAGHHIALDPFSVGLPHAVFAIILGCTFFVAPDAEDVVALDTVLLGLKFDAAHPALEAVLAGVLLLGVSVLGEALEPSANGVVNVLAGHAADEVVPHGHLALHAGRALPAVPQQVVIIGLVDV